MKKQKSVFFGWSFLTGLLLVAGSLPAFASTPAGLVGYWPLDEGSGLTVDELSEKSQEAIAGQPLQWEKDEAGAFLRFEEQKKATLQIPSSPAWDYPPEVKGDLTICFRVKVEGGGWVLDHSFGGTPGAWGFFTEGKDLIFSAYLDKPWTEDKKNAKISFGSRAGWRHITLVWKRGKDGWIKGYVDGIDIGTVSDVPVTASYPSSLTLGGRTGGGFGWSTCDLRELTIFNRTLTADEVAAVAKDGVRLDSVVSVSSLKTDKILYRPAEKAAVSLRLRNTSKAAQKGNLSLTLTSGLNNRRDLVTRDIELAPGASYPLEEQVDLTGLEYGCEIRAALTWEGKTFAEKREFFQVADNFWRVGIGSASGPVQTARPEILMFPVESRALYANYFELFFWSPCDWSLHLAPAKLWWSGQACYPENEDNLIRTIELAHERGIRVAMYASCNPAGPFAWEIARKKPDWFLNAQSKLPIIETSLVEQLDNWNDPEFRKTNGTPSWVVLSPDFRRLEVLRYGIDRIIESARKYKWDAVRYDGHYTVRGFDEMSARNMRELKTRVWKELPVFQFSYNYGRAPEWRDGVTHEMREAMAGGGGYLQEGIRNWRYTGESYTNWTMYATNELRIAKMIHSMGGYYHCMWETENHPTPQAYYKFVYGLIAGGHPADYRGHVPLSPSWGAFMTRWSSLLWNPNLKRTSPENVDISDLRVQWKELMQEAVVGKDRKLVVLHLVNPPVTDAIAKTAFPPPRGAFTVTYHAPAGTKVVAARFVNPAAVPFDTELKPGTDPAVFQALVPGLEHWAMVVLELSGAFEVPATPAAFSEAPDPAQVERALKGRIGVRTIDPNKEDVLEAAPPATNGIIFETNRGSSGIAAQTTEDKDADDGLAQVMSYEKMKMGHGARFMGRTWLTMLQPGKYRVRYRIKWTGDKPDQLWKAHLYVTVPNQEGGKEQNFATEIASPNCWDGDAAKDFLPVPIPDAYRKMEPAGAYAYYEVEADVRYPTYISASAIVDTSRDGEHRFYMDHIKIDTLEAYTDSKLEQWMASAKSNTGEKVDEVDALLNPPDDIPPQPAAAVARRQPNGKTPLKVLEVRGVQARFYRVGEIVPSDTVYDLPADAARLFDYDAVVLANYDFAFTSWQQRRNLRDFVRDGGRLVILGGIATLGQGAMKNTYLEEMLPVTLKGDSEVVPCATPVLLGGKSGKPYDDRPALFWLHNVTFLPKAEVMAYAGAEPVAAFQAYGKGRVGVFAGTVLGEPAAGERAFWETESWTKLLNRMVGVER
jgi:hypothetical protein